MAATAGGIRAGRAFVEVSSNDSLLQKGLLRAEARLKAFANTVGRLGTKFVQLGAAAAVPLATTSKVFADYESQMARVRALTNASDDDFQRLGDRAKQLGRDTVFSASQAAEAMGNFALAGFKVDEILAAVGPTLDLAAAGQIGIAESADIAAKIMAGMGIEATDLGNAVDVMTKGMTTANTDILQLGEAFKFVGPIAKTAGISFEEITAAIQLLSNAGVQGEMAGSSLRGMILSLASPSKEAQDALNGLGVSTKDARGNFRSLAAILGDLERGLAGMGSGEKLGLLGTIFPDRQAAGAAELVAQGTERLAEATRELGDSTGTAARIARVQLDTLFGSFKIVLSALEGLAIEVGAAVGPTFRKWGEQIVAVTNTLAALVKANGPLIVAFAKGVVVVTAAGAALIGLGIAAKVAGVAIAGLRVVLGLVVSPLGLIVAATAAAGVAFLTLTETGRNAMGELRAEVQTAVDGMAAAIRAGNIQLAGEILWATLKVQWLKGAAYVRGIWEDWAGAIVTVFEDLTHNANRLAVDLWAGLQAGFVRGTGAIGDLWTRFTLTIADIWDEGVGNLQRAWMAFSTVFGGSIRALGALFSSFWSAINMQRVADEWKATVDSMLAENDRLNAEAERRRNARQEQRRNIGAGRDGELARIEAERKAEQDAIDRQQRENRDARFRASREATDRAAAELKAAQDELQGLLDNAGGQPGGEFVGPPDLRGKKKPPVLDSPGLLGGIAAAKQTVDVSGSFSATALRGLGVGSSVADRTAKAAERTADGVERLNDRARQGGLVFAR